MTDVDTIRLAIAGVYLVPALVRESLTSAPLMSSIYSEEDVQSREGVRSKAGGTGLGLAIARRIVAAHNGRIEAIGTPGVGLAVTAAEENP